MQERILYKKSPLKEVSFRLVFPTILSINSIVPMTFQDDIRGEYPFYQKNLEDGITIKFNGILKLDDNQKSQIHEFISSDKKGKVSLSSNFLKISTLSYDRWEDFREMVEKVVGIFEKNYKPSFYTKEELIYTNLIRRSKWNLEDKAWSELLQPQILGMMTAEKEKETRRYNSQIEYTSSEMGVTTKEEVKMVFVDKETKSSFLLNKYCYFANRIDCGKMINIADSLHDCTYGFIRHSVTDVLYQAMLPEVI